MGKRRKATRRTARWAQWACHRGRYRSGREPGLGGGRRRGPTLDAQRTEQKLTTRIPVQGSVSEPESAEPARVLQRFAFRSELGLASFSSILATRRRDRGD